ncbi:lysoplasmalogenase [Aliisedimentitalea scapharcae]|uniref:Lysoplasmalogenase n=1 Tax=Aliisedimentitalea scapharcae TaxID=1524259 RepID=A0ABZ2XT44_9RHOB
MFQTMDQSLMFVISAAAGVGYLFLTARPPSVLRSTIKTLCVAALALAAWTAGASGELVAALGLCAVGDYCLSRDGERAFMAGVGAFALGHLVYVVLFLTHPLSDPTRIMTLAGGAVVVMLALVGGGMAKVLAPRAGPIAPAVLAYIPIILAMAVSALTLPGQGSLIWAFPAAVSFMVSDLVLAVETFVLNDGHRMRRWTPYVVWPLYWGAQVGFFAAFA